jgi:hypothetical protein
LRRAESFRQSVVFINRDIFYLTKHSLIKMKKFLFGAAVVAAAGFGTFTANQNNNQAQLSDLELDNIEVLAEAEDNLEDLMERKVGPAGTNWASYTYFCHYSDTYIESGIVCVFGPGLCIFPDPC